MQTQKFKSLGWKEHFIRVGDGHGGWVVQPAEYQILQHPDGLYTFPFGIVQMDNGELILMCAHKCADGNERPVAAFSRDQGDTWSGLETIPDAAHRPLMLACPGHGELTFLAGFFIPDPTDAIVDLAGLWKFKAEGATRDEAAGWQNPGFDDSDWEAIEVPGIWGEVEQHRNVQVAWYRRSFEISEALLKRHAKLNLAGKELTDLADIYLNGRHLRRTREWNELVQLDVSASLKPGANTIAIRIENRYLMDGHYMGGIRKFLMILDHVLPTPAACPLFSHRFFSHDYGRTWPEYRPVQLPGNGRYWGVEGNPLVERQGDGTVRMAEIGCNADDAAWPKEPCDAFIRWSEDGGRTWINEVKPQAWRRQAEYKGKAYERSVCEGSLVRARNGWLVAALRTDIPPCYYVDEQRKPNSFEEETYNDSLCGTAVSLSKDDGKTWSPLQVLFEAGRHHAHLLCLPNGDIVMTLIVRVDVRDGRLAGYRRGCDALISRDHGLTWNLDRRIILDEYRHYNGVKWFTGECGHLCSVLLDDGRIVTAHANYLSKGVSLTRWQPPHL